MTAPEEPAWERTRIRVPRENGTFLIQPNPQMLVPQLRNRQSRTNATTHTIFGLPLGQFRKLSRAELLKSAQKWTSEILQRDISQESRGPLIMTGHQPELFHPGVFAKNIAAHHLADQTGGTGINLIVDNDLMKSSGIRVPTDDRDAPKHSLIAFDEPRPVRPWESARVLNSNLLNIFGDRISELMAAWNVSPIVNEFWPTVIEASLRADSHRELNSLANCISAGRVGMEYEWGIGNLELPISQLCRTISFQTFASHVLVHAEEFREVYNQTLAEYRAINHIRSTSHPVPGLRHENGWCESPFWLLNKDATHRYPAFVRRTSEGFSVATGPHDSTVVAKVPLTPSSDYITAIEDLSLMQSGFQLRTRALTTTLYSRLCLCDLFIHGIGGAKYDAMTDRIATRFFGVKLPEFLTLSSTVWLPFAEPHNVAPEDAFRLRQQLRDLQQNPQRHLPPDIPESARALVSEKEQLIDEQNSSKSMSRESNAAYDSRRGEQRYRRIPEINRALAEFTRDQQTRLRGELSDIEGQLAANTIIKSREFSFCLYPAETIHKMIDDLKSRLTIS